MESENKNHTCGCGMGWAGCKGECHTGKGRLLKCLVRLAILMIVFCVGVKLGEVKGFIRAGFGERSGVMSMHTAMMMHDGEDDRSWGMMGKKHVSEKDVDQMHTFGVITKVAGNTITISNNAAQEQMVVSQADTMIVSSVGEISLSALKVGQSIAVFGTENAEKALVAQVIKVADAVK